jgi:hypothetical protein
MKLTTPFVEFIFYYVFIRPGFGFLFTRREI